ncbi:MAG TPA: hypothetical protein VNJ46_06260 [Gaiellaceae bacterium]|nr:hypothetical protein [Gaiellaceae bacterium]
MEKAERDAILRQGVVLPETPRQRRERLALEEDLKTLPARGRPLALHARSFRPSADTYLAAARGPLHYMVRLHEIERRTAALEEELRGAWRALAEECAADPQAFARRWRAAARRVDVHEINDLIDRHNRWYPAESQLPMDPSTGDYVLVNGRHYRLEPLGPAWVLERFPPRLEAALAA